MKQDIPRDTSSILLDTPKLQTSDDVERERALKEELQKLNELVGSESSYAKPMIGDAEITIPSIDIKQPTSPHQNTASEQSETSAKSFVGSIFDVIDSITEAAPTAPETTTSQAAPESYHQLSSLAISGEAPVAAIILPLSGRLQAEGTALKHAIELAAKRHATQYGRLPLRLAFFDSQGTEEGLTQILPSLMAAAPQIIIGPLLSNVTSHLLGMIQAVPVLSLSNDTSLGKKGAYVLGLSPAEQVKRLLQFSHQQGMRNFAGLLPQNTFGYSVSSQMQSFFGQASLPDSHIEWYSSLDNDLSKAIKTIKDASKMHSEKSYGILIPEGGQNLDTIVRRLLVHGEDHSAIRLLGLGTWDTNDVKETERMVGAWYTAIPQNYRRTFEASFLESYDYAPPRIAAIGYDAAALVLSIAQQNSGMMFGDNILQNPSGFIGVNGHFRFNQDRVAQHAYAIMEVKPSGNVILDKPVFAQDFLVKNPAIDSNSQSQYMQNPASQGAAFRMPLQKISPAAGKSQNPQLPLSMR